MNSKVNKKDQLNEFRLRLGEALVSQFDVKARATVDFSCIQIA